MKSPLLNTSFHESQLAKLPQEAKIGRSEAQKKLRCWIRSRHLICSGHFYIFETVDYSAVDRFEECISTLGGTLLSVEPIDKVWIGDHRQVILYQAKASLLNACGDLKQYWIKYGHPCTRFENRV